jgi:hypothetical protein
MQRFSKVKGCTSTLSIIKVSVADELLLLYN